MDSSVSSSNFLSTRHSFEIHAHTKNVDMFSKIFIFFAVLALLIQIVVATPPACVLKAVNGPDSSPGNVKEICGNGSNVKQALVSDCGTNFDAAMSAFSSICSSVGITISTWDAAPSSTTLASSDSAGTSSAASTAMTTSDNNSDTPVISASNTESTVQSTNSGIITATATGSLTSSQVPSTSAATTSSGATSTGAAGRAEMSALAMGAIAAGVMIAF
ncbi:hypothetical protein D6D19_05837 [Aureobasidium pullulans]|uniref:Extracellular membrane protein CFEM domain-containing protein n=1 Tax=Aureobasidium pullulans TaxID=5580 RepID=A0A4S9A2R0_AURPU|nr:hypothetical protein D6D19_05837 [Aureobasidium pullulans]THY17684.1 hypothetical protein D6D00_08399 [Aureobasidium pullulans]